MMEDDCDVLITYFCTTWNLTIITPITRNEIQSRINQNNRSTSDTNTTINQESSMRTIGSIFENVGSLLSNINGLMPTMANLLQN